MIFPLNWLRQESAFVRRNFDSAFQAEWVHVVAHLALFAGLVILLLYVLNLPQNIKTAVLVTVIVLVLATVQEILQLQVKGRDFGGPEWFDLGVDLVGGLFGWWVFKKFMARESWGRLWGANS